MLCACVCVCGGGGGQAGHSGCWDLRFLPSLPVPGFARACHPVFSPHPSLRLVLCVTHLPCADRPKSSPVCLYRAASRSCLLGSAPSLIVLWFLFDALIWLQDKEDVSDVSSLWIFFFRYFLEIMHFDLIHFINPRGHFCPVWIVFSQQEATEWKWQNDRLGLHHVCVFF